MLILHFLAEFMRRRRSGHPIPMSHAEASRLALLGLAALLCLPPDLARAEDTWDPFGQLDSAGQRRKQSAKPDDARPPPLAAMDGRKTPPAGPGNLPPQTSPAGRDAPSGPAGYGYDRIPGNSGDDATAGSTGAAAQVLDERNRGVERGELAPVVARDGSGLPFELWRGLDTGGVEAAIAKLDIPPRSPAVHALWRRLITAGVTAPGGSASDPRFDLMRAEALYRSGLLEDAAKAVPADGTALASNPVLAALAARTQIGLGQLEKGCDIAKGYVARKAELPKSMQGEALLVTGLCAAVRGNPSAAGLIAELAREEKPADAVTIAALDAIAGGHKSPARGLKSVSLLQYRAFALAGGVETKDVLLHGEPALLIALARDRTAEPALQLAAAEAAARVNALTPAGLADVYRALGATAPPEALLAANAVKSEPAAHRAALFKSAEAERTPLKKVRVLRAFLDDAKRAGLYLQALEMLSASADTVQPVPEIGWFAETGVEIALASNHPERARQWTALGGAVPGDNGLRHWLALIDIADPALESNRGRSLASIEELALRGRLPGDLLHRLATVLDANDTDVPIPLWEAASKAPQPTGGYLPETGVLSELQDASKKKEFGRTVLLVMRALGPNGGEGANMISLGDSIRALRRAGLEPDARRLGFEALFAQWPRSAGN